jgi:hypothetical protein
MQRSLKQLYGCKLGATDGEIGDVKDFYFEDQTWKIRFLVADTGTWLPGRQVLLSPHAFGPLQQDGRLLPVNLTRKQIEGSPSNESHKTVSRQYEEEYYRYYGWPCYRQGGGMLGASGTPIVEQPASQLWSEPPIVGSLPAGVKDAHLRSAQAVNGYHLQATDGIFGFICDFLMDDQSWVIDQLIIKIGHRFSGKEVQIPTDRVDRISYEQSTVYVSLTGAAVEQSPVLQLVPVGTDA